MQYVALMSFCERIGLTAAEVNDYETRGIIQSTAKGANRFYSLREVYRMKGILHFIRTEGLSPEAAAAKIDKEAITGINR
jgi:DNA-binding transcriptional MerR regulator